MTIYILLAVAALVAAAFFIQRRPHAVTAPAGRSAALVPSAALPAIEQRRQLLRALLPLGATAPKTWTTAHLPLLQDVVRTHLQVEQHSLISFDDDGEMKIDPACKVFNVDLAYALGEALGDICIQRLPSFHWKAATREAGLPFDIEQNPIYLTHDLWQVGIPMYGAVVRAVQRGQPVDLRAILDTMVERTRTILEENDLMGQSDAAEDTAPAALMAEPKKEGHGPP